KIYSPLKCVRAREQSVGRCACHQSPHVLTDSHDPPSDVAALQALILAERAERRTEQAASAEAIAARTAELAAKQIEIEHLRAILAKLRRQRYGRSSEKLDAAIDQLGLTLQAAEVGQADAQAEAAQPTDPTDHYRGSGEARGIFASGPYLLWQRVGGG